MDIRYWAGTDVGRKRAANEDNFLIDKSLRLFVVADGMGGHAAGEVASAMAVHAVRDVLVAQRDILESYDPDDTTAHIEVCTLLEYAVHRACETIHVKASREPEKKGMGTTLVVLILLGDRGFIAYVGDSRIYLVRGGVVYQLTEDHSLINELVRRGKVRAEEFDDSPYANFKNAMTRAVGVNEMVEVDTLDFDVLPGDAYLLCSDGLYEYIDDQDIAGNLTLPKIEEIPGRLIDLANTRGGKDNITAVVVQVPGDDSDVDRAAEVNLTLDTLKSVPLFTDLSYQQLVRLMNLTRNHRVEEGQVICREGDPGDEFFVVLAGEVDLAKGGTTITTLGPGDHFGEMALLDRQSRSATATAKAESRLLSLSRHDFYEILRKEAPLAVKLLWSFLGVLNKRLRRTTADLSEARMAIALPDMTEDVLDP